MRTSLLKPAILIVDDDPICRMALKSFLSEDRFSFVEAENGQEALNIIDASSSQFKLIITDWYMPEMDGLAFIEHLATGQYPRSIPVIMQTNNTENDALLRALNAGAHVFLSKPIDCEVLNGIVDSLLLSIGQGIVTPIDSQFTEEKTGYSHYLIKSFEDAVALEKILSSYFPNPDSARVGIHELLINAIEHGNLGITYEEKSQLLQENRWLKEIQNRIAQKDHASKTVNVELIKTDNEVQVTIEDQGAGFNYSNYLEIHPDRMLDLHGRGIAMSCKMSFDQVNYIGTGNKVVVRTFI